MIIDLHCDTISRIRKSQDELRNNNLHLDLVRMKEVNYLVQCFAMFIYKKATSEPYKTCMEMIELYKKEIAKNSDLIKEAFSYKDIIQNMEEGKMSSLLTLEDACSLEGSIDKLEEFYNKGVRMIGLTWNFENEVGYPNFNYNDDGSFDFHTPNTSKEYGLTEKGKEIVRKMNELGMLVDVSHLSDAGFYDVANLVKGPFVASHSNARKLSKVVRNLTDDMIKVIIEHRGLIGINYCKEFVKEEGDSCTIKDTIEHIKYIKELGGIDSLALGSDFDGIGDENELNNCLMLPKLIEELKNAGFTDEEIDKITYKNALRVMKEVLK